MNNQRKILFAITAIATFNAAPAVAQESGDNHASSDNYVSVGIGAMSIESPFSGENERVLPLPILSIKQGAFYFEGAETGLKLDTSVSGLTPSVQAFVAARNTVARDRQKFTADAGARLTLGSKLGDLSAEYRHDITGTFDGGEVILRYQLPINLGRFTIRPAAQVNFLDQATANHMYGVTAKQRARAIRKGRDVILPIAPITDSATNFGTDLTATYQISDKLTLIGVFANTYLDRSIRRSPAIDRKSESQAFVGLTYSF
jgi:outer membrane protein